MKRFLLLMVLPLSGCATLDAVNAVLTDTNAILAGDQSYGSKALREENQKAVENAIGDEQAVAILQSNSAIVGNFLTDRSCQQSKNVSVLNKYAGTGESFDDERFSLWPTYCMKNHSGGCASVKDVFDVELVAANTVQFKTLYISNSSQETDDEKYSIRRQSDGSWKFIGNIRNSTCY